MSAEKAAAVNLPFTAEFPRVQDLSGSSAFTVAPHCTTQVQTCVRDYLIHAPDGKPYPIYVEAFSAGQLGQFYDVQGTSWTDAPLFANPNQSVRVGKRTYELFYVAAHLSTVAWREYGAVYWVHNTLSDTIGNGELLAIAEQTEPLTPVTGTGAVRPGGDVTKPRPNLAPVLVPTRTVAPLRTSTAETIGAIGGVVALLALPLLTFGLVRRRRQLRRLRARLFELENRRDRLLAAAEATRAAREALTRPSPPGGPAGPASPPTPASHVATG
ncbi:MAG: hypothetical protein JO363_13140 [Solirubrobacterales bacterium]|nr:hypothetical protein [Solirubrobacterales bacterium]